MHDLLATQIQQPGKLSVYNVVVFLHIAGAILAFGVTFAYPIIFAAASRGADLKAMAWFHEQQGRIDKLLITPAATLVLLSGVYMATAGDAYSFSKAWWTGFGLFTVVLILGLAGAFFAPRERRAAALAERDAAAGGAPSEEYAAVGRQLGIVGSLASLLVLVTVLLMVIKPGT